MYKNFEEYIFKIENEKIKEKLMKIFEWIEKNYPMLDTRIAWNQPMFTHHGTFIIGFSFATSHISVAPEWNVIDIFREEIENSGYKTGKKIFRITLKDELPFGILKDILDFTIDDKKEVLTFWKPQEKKEC